MKPNWTVTPEKINEALRRIIETANPVQVYLFGSAARNPSSARDADFLIVLGRGRTDRKDVVKKLYPAMRGLFLSVDMIVVTEDVLDRYRDVCGYIYREALREGEIVYETA